MKLSGDCFDARESTRLSAIFTWWHIGECDVFDDGNAKFKPKMSLEDGITGMAQIPKAASQRGYLRQRPCGNTLGQSTEEGGIPDNEQTSPTQGVLTLKRKSFFLWNPNELMRGPRSKHTPMPSPVNQILRCLSMNQNWCLFVFYGGFFFSISPSWPEQP